MFRAALVFLKVVLEYSRAALRFFLNTLEFVGITLRGSRLALEFRKTTLGFFRAVPKFLGVILRFFIFALPERAFTRACHEGSDSCLLENGNNESTIF
jgi:hypothetical protein